MSLSEKQIEVYTDGSCHTQARTGAWVAIVFAHGRKIVLHGIVSDTTHQRMELTAVIEAILFLEKHYPQDPIILVTDSQYVTGLPDREERLVTQKFLSRNGNTIANVDLIKRFYAIKNTLTISFIKIKAHQRNADMPYNNDEADFLSRSLIRQSVKNTI